MPEHSSCQRALPDQFDLGSRTALVTGGTGYLGRAFCSALAQAGASVVVASRDKKRAIDMAATLPTDAKQQHHGIALDYNDADSIEAGYRQAVDATGFINILVNNGHMLDARDWQQIDAEGFRLQMQNATGYFLLSRMVRDQAVAMQRPASIVMLGSMYGKVASYPDVYAEIGSASSVAYQCLKAGVAQMARHLAVYWAPDRVRVNTLSPGPFPNPDTADPQLLERLVAKSPMGRIGHPPELQAALLFLCCDASSYVTGHNLVVDGGWTAW
jgi:gluconate 5-dehydrogenase